MARPTSTHYTTMTENFGKGTNSYKGTTTQHASAVSASEFGEPGDTYTSYDDSATPKKVSAIYVSVGTAWVSY
jgi:hypothetical protein